MSAVVHRMRGLSAWHGNVAPKYSLDPLCGTKWREGMLFASLAHGRGYRWCKRCQKVKSTQSGEHD